MPDIAFHLSSETADANGHCPNGDRTRITLPLEPALQIPLDAKPVAWLHNLAFSNAIANVSASDGSDSLVLGTGDGACTFNKGSTPAGVNPWIGIRYKASDGTTYRSRTVGTTPWKRGLQSLLVCSIAV